MTVEELKNRYKVIEAKRINDDIVSVDLYYDEKKSNCLHIKLLFAYNKLYYTGDYGTYVFGENICNIFNFFKGERINEGYWQEKCEAQRIKIICQCCGEPFFVPSYESNRKYCSLQCANKINAKKAS